MSEPRRLGLLGGTFDPPHVGHLVVAQDVIDRLRLDRLLVVPAGQPPHREAAFSAADRLRMVREAFSGDGRFEVADVEVRRAGPSYTVDTLEWVRRERRPPELFLIIGADQLRAFGEWHRPERILELATLAVMTRPGDEDVFASTPFPCERVEVTRVDLSSSRIRERLAGGQSVRYLVPESVRRLVEERWAEAAAGQGAGAGARGAT